MLSFAPWQYITLLAGQKMGFLFTAVAVTIYHMFWCWNIINKMILACNTQALLKLLAEYHCIVIKKLILKLFQAVALSLVF